MFNLSGTVLHTNLGRAPLDEPALRRPSFRPGIPIQLGDGQPWYFAPPRLEFHPVFAADGTVSAGLATDLGPEFDEAVRLYEVAITATRFPRRSATTNIVLVVGVAVIVAIAVLVLLTVVNLNG